MQRLKADRKQINYVEKQKQIYVKKMSSPERNSTQHIPLELYKQFECNLIVFNFKVLIFMCAY